MSFEEIKESSSETYPPSIPNIACLSLTPVSHQSADIVNWFTIIYSVLIITYSPVPSERDPSSVVLPEVSSLVPVKGFGVFPHTVKGSKGRGVVMYRQAIEMKLY